MVKEEGKMFIAHIMEGFRVVLAKEFSSRLGQAALPV